MVSLAQVQRGVAAFIDKEVSPQLSMGERVVVGTAANLFVMRLPNLMNNYASHPVVAMAAAMDVYDKSSNQIDLDALMEAASPYIGDAAIPLKLPLVGITLKMGRQEVRDLYNYIKEA